MREDEGAHSAGGREAQKRVRAGRTAPARRPTMIDVANEARVSQTTVSLVASSTEAPAAWAAGGVLSQPRTTVQAGPLTAVTSSSSASIRTRKGGREKPPGAVTAMVSALPSTAADRVTPGAGAGCALQVMRANDHPI